jgi:hypothetical protein
MMHAALRLRTLLWPLLLCACGDLSQLADPHPLPSGPVLLSIPPDGEPGDPGPVWPTRIIAVSSDIILPPAEVSYPAQGYLGAYMKYDGYHARIVANVAVVGPNPSSQTFFPQERHQPSFHSNAMNAEWGMLVGGKCGNFIEASLHYHTWWVGPGGWIIDDDEETGSASERQAACPPPTTSAGGGPGTPSGGGGGMMSCRMVEYHHYWWYPDTGQVEYRGTTVEQVCEYLY